MIVYVNKMDMAKYEEKRFNEVKEDVTKAIENGRLQD